MMIAMMMTLFYGDGGVDNRDTADDSEGEDEVENAERHDHDSIELRTTLRVPSVVALYHTVPYILHPNSR